MPGTSAIGAVISGLINNGRALPTLDLQNLIDAIQSNKQTNTSLINNLPTNLQPLYAKYQAALGGAGNTYQGATNTIGQNLLDQTQNLYGPNSPAVQATLAALKQQDYSTLPATLNSLKSSLAATGGLQRGGAASAIQKAVMAPATQFSQQAENVTGQQLTTQQGAVQQALNKIASMDETTAQQLFGMSKEQATQILTSGRQDLQNQLSELINTNNAATNATLGIEGLQANNAYQNAVTRNAQQAGLVNGLVNLGVQGANAAIGGFGGGGGASGGGADFAELSNQGLASTPPAGANYAPPGY